MPLAGIGVIQPYAKECLDPLESERNKKAFLPYKLQRKHGLVKTLASDFWLPEWEKNQLLLF